MKKISAVKHSVRIDVILFYIFVIILFFFSLSGKMGEGSIEIIFIICLVTLFTNFLKIPLIKKKTLFEFSESFINVKKSKIKILTDIYEDYKKIKWSDVKKISKANHLNGEPFVAIELINNNMVRFKSNDIFRYNNKEIEFEEFLAGLSILYNEVCICSTEENEIFIKRDNGDYTEKTINSLIKEEKRIEDGSRDNKMEIINKNNQNELIAEEENSHIKNDRKIEFNNKLNEQRPVIGVILILIFICFEIYAYENNRSFFTFPAIMSFLFGIGCFTKKKSE